MPETTWNYRARALDNLMVQIGVAKHWHPSALLQMSPREVVEFQKRHPGAHFVIGDFEIKCLKPEKYGL